MMRDFLTRLAEQALGAPPAIRPDIAPVFGPAAGIDTNLKPSLDNEESLTAAATPQASPSVALHPLEEQKRPLVERRAQDEPQPVMNFGVPVADKKTGLLPLESVLIPPVRNPHRRQSILNNKVESEADSQGISLTPKSARAEAQSPHVNWKQPPHGGGSTQSTVQGAIAPQTRATANAAVPRGEGANRIGNAAVPRYDAANRMGSAAPAVHVTIGRVEVRAIAPQAAPAQRIQEKKVSQTQSLWEYLQERNRGHR